MPADPVLVIAPMLSAFVSGADVGLTKKFVSGVEEQVRLWPGTVRVLMQPSRVKSDNLDFTMTDRNQLPFDLAIAPLNSFQAREVLSGAAVAQLGLDHHQTHLAEVCREIGVSCAYVTEYSLKTRVQIAKAETRNTLRFARRIVWEMNQELAYRRAVSVADAVLCNGTPTFRAYSKINRSPLLFFDTRTRAAQLATRAMVAKRNADRRRSGMLRLGFSGRLIAMKGVDHLMRVAVELRRAGKLFSLIVCGAGVDEAGMRNFVAQHGLSDCVQFMGILDFDKELVPFFTKNVDIFVSCHRQGDPSCTYLETMACGIPIAGYENEAFAGLMDVSGCGWTSTLNDPARLANLIAGLSDEEIDDHSYRSLEFASEHTFEREFARRSEHLQSLVL